MPGPGPYGNKKKAANKGLGRTKSEIGLAKSQKASGKAVSSTNLGKPSYSAPKTSTKSSKAPRARRNPLASKEVESAVKSLRERYGASGRTKSQEQLKDNIDLQTERNQKERRLQSYAAPKIEDAAAISRTDFIGRQNEAKQSTRLNAEGTQVERFRGRRPVGTPRVGETTRAARDGKLRREGKRFTTPEVRQTRRKVRRAKREVRRARAAVAKGGMPANVPAEYAKWIRKYSPRIDKMARQTYGLSGNEFMAKMLQGESGFDMSKVGPSTPYGNARGAAQFIPPTRDAFVEKFGIDPWRSTREAVQAMALHLDGKSYSKTFGIQGYNPGINDSYYLNQDVGPTTKPAPRARARLERAKKKASAAELRAAKLGLTAAGESEDRYKGPLPDNATVWPVAIKGTMGGGPEDHADRAFGDWQSDNAVDINVPVGTPVRAIKDGVITRTSGSPPNHSDNPAGWNVYLKDKNGVEYFYAHLEEFSVKPGDKVKAGDVIAKSGAANGVPHLHFATPYEVDPRDALKGATTKGGDSQKPKFVNYSKKGGAGTSQTKWLKPTGGNEVLKFQRPLAEALIALAKASGEPIQVNSGFRSNQEQAELYQAYLNGTGNLAAPPGQSNHNHGAAADVNLTAKQRELAPQFGLGFPVSGEDWHIELVGDAASQITSGGGGSYPSSGGGSSSGGTTTSGGATPASGPTKRKTRQQRIIAQLRELGYRVTPSGITKVGDAPEEPEETLAEMKRRYGIK